MNFHAKVNKRKELEKGRVRLPIANSSMPNFHWSVFSMDQLISLSPKRLNRSSRNIFFFATLIKSGGDFLLCLRSSAFQSSFHQGCRSLAPLCSKLQRAKAASRELLRWKTCCVDYCKSSSDISSRRHASKTSSVSLSKLKVQKLSLLYYRVT